MAWQTLSGPAADAAGTAGCKYWIATPDEVLRGVPAPSPPYKCPTLASRIAWESNVAGAQARTGIQNAAVAARATVSHVAQAAGDVFDRALDTGERVSSALTLLIAVVVVAIVLAVSLYVVGPALPAIRSWVASVSS